MARIGGGVGVLPGFRAWAPSTQSSMQEGSVPMGGMMASSHAGPASDSSIKKKVKDSPPNSRGPAVAESPLSLIVRYAIFELIRH